MMDKSDKSLSRAWLLLCCAMVCGCLVVATPCFVAAAQNDAKKQKNKKEDFKVEIKTTEPEVRDVRWQLIFDAPTNVHTLLPSTPKVFAQGLYHAWGYKVNSTRVYIANYNQMLVSVSLVEVDKPERYLSKQLSRQSQMKAASSTNNVTVDGVEGTEIKQTFTSGATFTTRYFINANYVIKHEVASRNATDAVAAQCLRDFGFGKAESLKESKLPLLDNALLLGAPIIENKEAITQKAVLAFTTEPPYTEKARKHQVQGKVRLRAVLSASGEVKDVQVLEELPHGLTESAVEAAQAIGFLPAMKDGKNVSQYQVFTFHFSMY